MIMPIQAIQFKLKSVTIEGVGRMLWGQSQVISEIQYLSFEKGPFSGLPRIKRDDINAFLTIIDDLKKNQSFDKS